MMRLQEDANGQELTFRVGETFEICLSETRTTGFKWALENKGEPVCTLLGESSDSPAGPPGRAGTHLWRFAAAQPGTATIVLHHRRPWEAAKEPARTFQLRVRVTS